MSQELDLQGVPTTLLRCNERGIERAPAGAQFICPVPKHGSQAFLHSLYSPCDLNALTKIRDLFGFALPGEYISFLKSHNGARLFVGAISVHGWGTTISRGLALEDRAAILLSSTHREYSYTEPAEWSLGWRPIGALVANTRHTLTVHPDGTFRLRTSSGRNRTWSSFTQMLVDCVSAANTCFDCNGITSGGYAVLDEVFESLAASAN